MLEKRVSTTGHIYAKLSSLKQWDKNPRDIYENKFKNLCILLATLGIFKPQFVTSEGVQVGGNMRLPALGWLNTHVLEFDEMIHGQQVHQTIDLRGQLDEVPITELGFVEVREEGKPIRYRATLDGKIQWKVFESIEQAMIEYAIADNAPAGHYDQQKAAELFFPYKEVINTKIYDLPLSEPVSMKTLIDQYQPSKNEPTPPVVEDEPPALDEVVVSKKGEVYQLGAHRLMCGDATSSLDMQQLMGDKKADLVFTDPLYNVAYEGKTEDKLKIQNDKQESEKFFDFLFAAFKNMYLQSKSGASIYVCHADTERVNFSKAFMDAGWKLAQIVIWAKGHFVMGRQDYQWQHEPILYGWKEGETHYYNGGRNQTTLWHVDRPSASKEHPTMKPIQLVVRALSNSSKGEDLILDPFAGSGSTLIAAEQVGRTCYAMELDPKYCDVIRKRYARFIGHKDDWAEATPVVNTPVERDSEKTRPTGEEGGENVDTGTATV